MIHIKVCENDCHSISFCNPLCYLIVIVFLLIYEAHKSRRVITCIKDSAKHTWYIYFNHHINNFFGMKLAQRKNNYQKHTYYTLTYTFFDRHIYIHYTYILLYICRHLSVKLYFCMLLRHT